MSSIRSKLDNIWYHYKSYIIVGIFLLGTLIVCLHSCVTKPEFDIYVYYVTGDIPVYKEQLSLIESAVAEHCGDVNGDGEINVAITNVKIGTGTSATERAEAMNLVNAGTVMLFFGDKAGINYLYQNSYIQSLRPYTEDLPEQEYAWKVSGSPFAKSVEGWSDLFSDTEIYMALRVFDGTWASAMGSVKKNFRVAETTLTSIISVAPSED